MAGRWTRYRALFHGPGFLPFFASLAIGEAGYSVYAVAVLWLALTVSGSPVIAGIVLAVEFGIYALSFLVGPVIDRARDLRTVLQIGYPVQAVLALLLGALALRGLLTVPTLLALIVALSITWDFTWTALNAVPPRIVPTDRLFLANGFVGAASGGNQIAGFAAGAALILLFREPGAAMLLYGALNLAAGLCALPLRAPSARAEVPSFGREFVDGWRFLIRTREPPLLSLTVYSALQALFSAAPSLLIAVLAYGSFPDPARAYGLLFTAFALGTVGGSLLLGEVAPRGRIGRTLVLACAIEGLLLPVAILVAPSLGPSLVAWAAVGFVDVAFYTTVIVFLQATVPTPLLGRTFTNAYLFRGGARSVGSLAAGALLVALVPLVGFAGLAGLFGGYFLAVALLVPLALPSVRTLRF